MVVRQIFRVPMSVFDEYRALCFKQPRMMNFFMMNMCVVFFLFMGKGIEKISLYSTGHQATYETGRRARRLFVPYFLANYKWRFPEYK